MLIINPRTNYPRVSTSGRSESFSGLVLRILLISLNNTLVFVKWTHAHIGSNDNHENELDENSYNYYHNYSDEDNENTIAIIIVTASTVITAIIEINKIMMVII